MKTSENIELLAAALIQAQAEFPSIEKGNTNPQFKSKYSNIDAVLTGCLPVLTRNGLCLIQPVSNGENQGVTITTRLMHKSGQWIQEDFTLWPERKTPQGMGSVITYGRRYAAKAMLGLSDEDDDAEAATIHRKPTQLPLPLELPKTLTRIIRGEDLDKRRLQEIAISNIIIPPAIKPEISVKERIPKMLDAFWSNFEITAEQVEAMLRKPLSEFDEESLKDLEQRFLELKKNNQSELESAKEVLTEIQNGNL